MSALHPKVLIIDSDPNIFRYIKPALMSVGYGLESAQSGALGLQIMAANPPDAVMLDFDLADIDAKEVLGRVRSDFSGPILGLSARQRDLEKIEALDLGADDFVDKPFSLAEVVARLRVAFRRRLLAAGISPAVHVGALSIDLVTRTATRASRRLVLTEHEYAVLATLAGKGGKVAPNETLLKALPPDRGAKHGNVGLVIRQLREKIEDDPRSPLLLTTERGVGYRLNISLGAAPSPAT